MCCGVAAKFSCALVDELWLPSDGLDSLDLTMDENKENQTPEVGQQQGELDWVQQYSLDQEREEQELQQALAQSLQEHVGGLFFTSFFN